MLMAVLMLGTSAAQIALQEEKASRNSRDRQTAFQAAQAALDDAVQDIERSPRSSLFSGDLHEALAGGCGAEQDARYWGLCRSSAETEPAPAWRTVDFMAAEGNLSAPYGQFTGRQFAVGTGLLPARLPRYLIEFMPRGAKTDDAQRHESLPFYRLTAIGFGVRESTYVVLQSLYRQRGERRPAERSGWREIINWEELHHARIQE